VVDDVVTSGATVSEAARVLKQAGAGKVTVWAIAKTSINDL
jgi:predicted amidophosphoribosyltransferase